MNITVSDRLDNFTTGVFADLNEKKLELERQGRKIFNFSIGTPDFEPAPHIVEAISEAACDPKNYIYSLRDLPELLTAVSKYYKKRFNVEVSEDEITSVCGTQEGMAHLGMALLSCGDTAIIPNPGYPIFETGVILGGAKPYFYPLKGENDFLPVFSDIPEDVAKQAKLMILSYPYNPVCAVAPDKVYEEAIEFAKKYNIIIIHDNAYSDIIYDGNEGGSFLRFPGAKEVGAEFFSLSKSFNVTGCRISFLVGNKKIIDALKLLRSQFDFGMFLPIQIGAIAALEGELSGVEKQKKLYEQRRDVFCQSLRDIGWDVPDSQGTMFVWAPIPPKFESSKEFCMELMEKAGIVCTPGEAFGSMGKKYVRFALVFPPEKLREAVLVIKESGILD